MSQAELWFLFSQAGISKLIGFNNPAVHMEAEYLDDFADQAVSSLLDHQFAHFTGRGQISIIPQITQLLKNLSNIKVSLVSTLENGNKTKATIYHIHGEDVIKQVENRPGEYLFTLTKKHDLQNLISNLFNHKIYTSKFEKELLIDQNVLLEAKKCFLERHNIEGIQYLEQSGVTPEQIKQLIPVLATPKIILSLAAYHPENCTQAECITGFSILADKQYLWKVEPHQTGLNQAFIKLNTLTSDEMDGEIVNLIGLGTSPVR